MVLMVPNMDIIVCHSWVNRVVSNLVSHQARVVLFFVSSHKLFGIFTVKFSVVVVATGSFKLQSLEQRLIISN